MIITDERTTSRGMPLQHQNPQKGDKLHMRKFNALPGPVIARFFGGGEWLIETLCVQTGAMRVDVCGKIDFEDFSMVSMLIDADGDEHDPDDFWLD